jgi:hypothetical protein
MEARGSSQNVHELSTKLHSITSKDIIIFNCYEVRKVMCTKTNSCSHHKHVIKTLVEQQVQYVSLETPVNLMGFHLTPLLPCTLQSRQIHK